MCIKRNNLITTFFTLLVCLFLFVIVSCSGGIEDNLVTVGFTTEAKFSENSKSVRIDLATDPTYAPENLYWTFTAVKSSKAYAYGASKIDSNGNPIEQSLSDNKGLDGHPKQFSKGKWDFTVYGYTDKDHTSANLVYKGFVSKELKSTDTDILLAVVLSDEPKMSHTVGLNTIKGLTIQVPAGVTFVQNSVLKFDVTDITEGTSYSGVKVAGCSLTLSCEQPEGSVLTVPTFTMTKSSFPAGQRRFLFSVTYQETSSAKIKMIASAYQDVYFVKGTKLTLGGNLNDFIFHDVFPVGGTIFAIVAGDRNYEFYDASGRLLQNPTNVNYLSTAAYYRRTVLDPTANDPKYFVFNSSLKVSNKKYLTANDNSLKSLVGKITNENNLPGSVSTYAASSTSNPTYKRGKTDTKNIINSTSANKGDIWSWVASTNNSNSQGCNDWYVPSMYELILLVNSGKINGDLVSGRQIWSTSLCNTVADGSSKTGGYVYNADKALQWGALSCTATSTSTYCYLIRSF